MSVQQDLVRRLLDEIGAGRLVLPTLPEVATTIGEIVRRRDADAARVAAEVAKDPAVASRLLTVANSAGVRGTKAAVTHLQQAITRLGFALTRVLVSQTAMKQVFTARSPTLRKFLRESWRESLEVAALSQVLAKQHTRLGAETAMFAGLVHQVGVLPVVKLLDQNPQWMQEEAKLRQIVRSVHPQVANLVLKLWKFPEELNHVPRDAHHFARVHDGAADYADIVCVAILLTQGAAGGALAGIDRCTVPAFARLGISTEIEVVEMPETHDAYAWNLKMLGA